MWGVLVRVRESGIVTTKIRDSDDGGALLRGYSSQPSCHSFQGLSSSTTGLLVLLQLS